MANGWCDLSRTPLDILNLFIEFPGDLLFFLLVIAFSQGSLFLAFGHRSRFPYEHATRRYVIATAGLVIVWLLMLGAAFVAQYAALDPHAFMPPLERLAYSSTLLFLAWAFLSANFPRWCNRSNLIVISAILPLVLFYLSGARQWLDLQADGLQFNATEFAPLWSALPVIIGGAGLLLTVFNFQHIVDAPLKSLFFLIFIAGNGWDLWQLQQGPLMGNYLGGARLAYTAGLVFLPLIIYRLAIALLENSLVEVVLAASQAVSSVMPAQNPPETGDEADPLLAESAAWNFAAAPAALDSQSLLSAIGIMLQSRDNAAVPQQIAQAALETLDAEVCALLRVQENNYADVIAGYDQVAQQSLAGISLNLKEQPTLLAAARRGESTILFPDYQPDELQDLFRRLRIRASGSVHIQPLTFQDELIAVLLLSRPYRQTELSPAEMDALRDIGFVAGQLLAWSLAAARPAATEADLDAIADKPSAPLWDRAALLAQRRDLETGLLRVIERSRRLTRQIAELKQQSQEQHSRLQGSVADASDEAAAQRLTSLFDEQAQLRHSCEASARALLDAETVLRIASLDGADSDETLAQVIREYLHKEYNLLLNARDRLRRQINSLLVLGQGPEAKNYEALWQTLADESAQLSLERDQQKRRLEAILEKLTTLGLESDFSALTQVLFQLYAERKVFRQQLVDMSEDRAALLDERERLREAGAGQKADEELQRQIKHLSADHEQLLTAREEMRRRITVLESEKGELQSQNEALQAELTAKSEGQETIQQHIRDLAQERDNLLIIRDQLRAKVAALNAANAEDPEMNREIVALRERIGRLTQQREQLALDLSDARAELAAVQESSSGQASVNYTLMPKLLEEMRQPLTAIADYSNLLLAESIGILGAAQLQVLRLLADDVSRLTEMIAELQGLAEIDASPQSALDLVSLIEAALREQSADFTERGLSFELTLDDVLPSLPATAASVRHILDQLLRNAGAVSPPGTQIIVDARARRLRLPEAEQPIDAVQITVVDKGGGIAPADLPRIFARKYRRKNAKIIGLSDTGVGMTVARAIARAHQGDLWVKTQAGEGAQFHLALPLQLSPAIED